jgi:predicted RNA-binding Zn-ribbon protein involved in translation (DUF1610 family)
MASWTLRCPDCGNAFVHSPIVYKDALDYVLPPNPEFPIGGSKLTCPNCGHSVVYQLVDLRYQA